MSPAAVSSSTASATSKVISRPCVRAPRGVADGVVPPSVTDGLARAVSIIGAHAKRRAVESVTSSEKASTGASTATSATPVTVKGASRTSSGTAR